MGCFTSQHPKCMTEIQGEETILSRQLKLLAEAGITKVVITTGPFEEAREKECYHFGGSAEVGAKDIIMRLKEKQEGVGKWTDR